MANKLTEWLPPSAAAARPGAPGKGIYLHLATDTGAVSAWDGSAWQSVGGGGGGASVPAGAADDLVELDGVGGLRARVPGATGTLLLDAATPAAARASIDAVPTTRMFAGLDLSADRSASALLAALGLLWTPSLASSSGWTDVSSGGGSVVITGGALTGTVPGSTAATIVGAATLPWGSTDGFDLRARVQIAGDTTANAKAHLRVLYGGDGFFVVPKGNGSLELVRTLGGYASLATVASRPVDGTGWVRLRVVGQRVTVWYGTGSGSSEPSATGWTLIYDADQAALLSSAGPTGLLLGGQTEGVALSTNTTFAWRSVSVRSLAGSA